MYKSIKIFQDVNTSEYGKTDLMYIHNTAKTKQKSNKPH